MPNSYTKPTYKSNNTVSERKQVIGLLGMSRVHHILNGDDMAPDEYSVLFEAFEEEMPYGVQKARTEDPEEWLHKKLDTLFMEAL